MLTSWLNLKEHAKRHPALWWGASLGVGALLYLKVWLPVTKIGVPCVFRVITRFYCPGCGMTHVAISLLKLDFHQAFRYNPLVFCLLPLFVIYLIAQKRGYKRFSSLFMTFMVIATLLFGLLRNIPYFDWLAPTRID